MDKTIKGRGASSNSTSRFLKEKTVEDYSSYGWMEEGDFPNFKTEVLSDYSKTIVTKNSSPDICFTYSINPYRGCEHGCSYCYARPTHEYLGFSAGIDFESKIFVKHNASELLTEFFMKPAWNPAPIFMSGVTDCYQPLERKLKVTRSLLEVFHRFKNPLGMITKNSLILRDLDLLSDLAKDDLVQVCVSITTLNADLARKLEPRTSSPQSRLNAVEELSKNGIPVSVNLAPIIPGLTDHEIPLLLKEVSERGALSADYVPIRLPYSVKDLFSEWLAEHYPERKNKVLRAIQDIRQGQLNDKEFGSRMQGIGKRAEMIENSFRIFKKKFNLEKSSRPLNLTLFQRPGDQLSLL